jgi:lipocalin
LKNPPYFVFTLFLALVLTTCSLDDNKGKGNGDDDGDGDKSLTLDQRLVGGRWYQITRSDNHKYTLFYTDGSSNYRPYSDGYYEFVKVNDKYFYISEGSRINNIYGEGELLFDTEVYSKEGVIYWKHNKKKMMEYMFHNQFPYPDSEWFLLSSERSPSNKIASNGDLITYRLYDYNEIVFEASTGIQGWRYLLRLPEDES